MDSNLDFLQRDPNNDYLIITKIGRGTFGSVHQGAYRPTGEFAALKEIYIRPYADFGHMETEIHMIRRCMHPNILRYHRSYIHNNCLWIVTEYCSGGCLQDIVHLLRTLEESQIAFIIQETLKGVDYLHHMQVIHRDIKGGNLLLSENGAVKLADFGIATQKEKRHTFIGTPYWMAPEIAAQVRSANDHAYNYKCDIWSVGITAIELAEAEPPHFQETMQRFIAMLGKRSYKPPTLRRPDRWSFAFSDFLAHSLVISPSKRPECASLLQHSWFLKAEPPLSDASTRRLIRQYREAKLIAEKRQTDRLNAAKSRAGRAPRAPDFAQPSASPFAPSQSAVGDNSVSEQSSQSTNIASPPSNANNPFNSNQNPPQGSASPLRLRQKPLIPVDELHKDKYEKQEEEQQPSIKDVSNALNNVAMAAPDKCRSTDSDDYATARSDQVSNLASLVADGDGEQNNNESPVAPPRTKPTDKSSVGDGTDVMGQSHPWAQIRRQSDDEEGEEIEKPRPPILPVTDTIRCEKAAGPMGAGFINIFGGCPYPVHSAASWISDRRQYVFLATSAGLYALYVENHEVMLQIHKRPCLALCVVKNVLVSMSVSHKQNWIYTHDLLSIEQTKLGPTFHQHTEQYSSTSSQTSLHSAIRSTASRSGTFGSVLTDRFKKLSVRMTDTGGVVKFICRSKRQELYSNSASASSSGGNHYHMANRVVSEVIRDDSHNQPPLIPMIPSPDGIETYLCAAFDNCMKLFVFNTESNKFASKATIKFDDYKSDLKMSSVNADDDDKATLHSPAKSKSSSDSSNRITFDKMSPNNIVDLFFVSHSPLPVVVFDVIVNSKDALTFRYFIASNTGILGQNTALRWDVQFSNNSVVTAANDFTSLPRKRPVNITQLEAGTFVVCYDHIAQVVGLNGRAKKPKQSNVVAELEFPFPLENAVVLRNSVLGFHQHGMQGRSWRNSGAQTQDVLVAERSFRLVGSDRLLILEAVVVGDDPFADPCDSVSHTGTFSTADTKSCIHALAGAVGDDDYIPLVV